MFTQSIRATAPRLVSDNAIMRKLKLKGGQKNVPCVKSSFNDHNLQVFSVNVNDLIVGGVTHYDFCKFATILQVATIIFYYLILFLLILTCTPEQYTCTSSNTLPTTFHRNIRKTL